MKYSSRVTCSELAARFDGASAEKLLRQSAEAFAVGLVASTSFGIQSAVLLHMISRVVPHIPVIWIDTGYMPAETYQYAADLTSAFAPDLRIYQSRWTPARMEALFGRLWESDDATDLDRYHALRKVEPMQRALRDLEARAWISGIRRDQTSHRRAMSRVMEQDGIVRIHPLFYWSDAEIRAYFEKHDLPHHPLEAVGYRTIGDRQLSAPVIPDPAEDDGSPAASRSSVSRLEIESYRQTRFKGKREECGLHMPKGEWDALRT